MTVRKSQLKLESELIHHSSSSFYRARIRQPRKRVVVKAIQKTPQNRNMINNQCALFRWFSFFGMIDVNRIYDFGDLKIIEMPDTTAPIDIIADDCTISEKTAIGLLYIILTHMCKGIGFFTEDSNSTNIPNETKLLASTICALLSGKYDSEIIPGEPLLCQSLSESPRNISRSLHFLLEAMLSSDPQQRPTPQQCLNAELFQTAKAKYAIEDLSAKLHPISVPAVAAKKIDIDNLPHFAL